ncbi:THUMP domain-containing class I SAM-dependent RNA methyltransferase [Algirhabdus cladophorae]|uniref:THUMP domain-containing class I SAM-dependent RNA methyltransferase n=1 Tax=Algirhabdus cladophorae TaxID=3377108 RepID=UPI003B846686
MSEPFEIFLVATPGLETPLAEEARQNGFKVTSQIAGGVLINGDWQTVYRANLVLRGATRILARIGAFRVMHLAQLDKRARKFPWADILRTDLPLRVETTCRKSRIYHDRAATQRIETALKDELGITIDAKAKLVVKVRIEDDLCTISLDTSGDSLHKRGHKEALNKAPMRETMAAMFLRQCGYTGDEPVYDPMCGSGTFVIEAAEIAAGLMPGRTRDFAFFNLSNFDPEAWSQLRQPTQQTEHALNFYGSDRDAGAITISQANAARAGVSEQTAFSHASVSDIKAPDGSKGLVIVNPPYGGRIGNKQMLFGLYGALGATLKDRFKGWRVGVITSDGSLAKATGLPFKPTGAWVDHGGTKIKLWRTDAL